MGLHLQLQENLKAITKNRYQNFQIGFSKNSKDLHKYYEIREQCYRNVPNGPKDFDGREDAYDKKSDIMIVKSEGEVIGGARIYGKKNSNDLNLPLEEGFFLLEDIFPEKKLKKNSYCEFGRMAVLEPFRSKELLKQMVTSLCHRSIERGYKYLFTMSPAQQARCYKMIINEINFPFKYQIHKDIALPQKSENISGSLKMHLSSLQFPSLWENDIRKEQPLIYLQKNNFVERGQYADVKKKAPA